MSTLRFHNVLLHQPLVVEFLRLRDSGQAKLRALLTEQVPALPVTRSLLIASFVARIKFAAEVGEGRFEFYYCDHITLQRWSCFIEPEDYVFQTDDSLVVAAEADGEPMNTDDYLYVGGPRGWDGQDVPSMPLGVPAFIQPKSRNTGLSERAAC